MSRFVIDSGMASVRELDDLFFRESRRVPAAHLFTGDARLGLADISRLLPALPVLAGALLTLLAGLALVSLSVPLASWLPPLLMLESVLMVALAVERERVPWLWLASLNLVVVLLGSWWHMAGDMALVKLGAWHLLLVASSLVWPPRRRDGWMRLWLGSEAGVLALAALFL